MTKAELLELLTDNLSTALLVLGTDLRLSYISPSAQAMLELSESRSLGHYLYELFPLQIEFVRLRRASSIPEHAYTHRGISLQTGGGHEIVVDCVVSPMVDGNRQARGVIIELHPVDRILRINREEGLIASQENTQALMRGLAHEIKNPLGGVRGAAQLLARELPDPALEEYTNIIIEESDRLRALVDRMLGPHREPQLESLNIHEVIEHVRLLLQAEVGSEVHFERDYDPSLPNLEGDRSLLIQAILNIVSNAVQATESVATKRKIRLSSRVQRQFTIGGRTHRLVARLSIADNGHGIAPELRDALFIPMVSGRPEGSGLGLAISQSIVNRHRGLIEFSSEPGHTVFNIYLPLDSKYA